MKKMILCISILLVTLTGCSNKYKSAEGKYDGCSYMRKVSDGVYQVGFELKVSEAGKYYYEKIETPIGNNWKEFSQYMEPMEPDQPDAVWKSPCGFSSMGLVESEYYSISEENVSKVQELFEKYSYTIVLKDKKTDELYLAEAVWPLKIIQE